MKISLKRLHKTLTLFLALVFMIGTIPTYNLSAEGKTGKTYYVSANGKDDSDGLSQEAPMSLFKANATMYHGGDKVLFKRGEVFYGNFTPLVSGTNNSARLQIGAYGGGSLPTFSFAKIVSKAWTNNGNGFYSFDLTDDSNFSGIRNKQIAFKDIANVGFFRDSNGKIYGERKRDAESCKKEFDFYCDDKAIYIKTDKDPFSVLGELKLAIHGCLIYLNMGVNVSDLHLEYCGYGLSWNPKMLDTQKKFAEVKNCVIENLGGTVIDVEKFTRAGNGVELFDAGDNVTITKNIFRNIYDVGFTCQGRDPGIWKNITVSENIFAYCTQVLEFWNSSTTVGAGIYNFKFENNLCIKNGEGWASLGGTPRSASTDILIYGYSADAWQFNVSNNTFYHSNSKSGEVYYCHGNTVDKLVANMNSDNNYIYHLNDKSNIFVTDEQGPQKYQKLKYNIEEWRTFSKRDLNSMFTSIEKNLDNYKTMEEIAFESQNYHEIAKSASDSGIILKLNFDVEKANNPDLGDTITDKTSENEFPWLYIIIGGIVVLVVIIVVVAIILTKKKR